MNTCGRQLKHSQVVIFAAFGSLFTGYALAVIGNTLGQPTFYSTMNLAMIPADPAYSHTRAIIGAANGVFFAAGFIGCLIAAWSADALGRINTFRLAAALGLVGGTLQCAAVNQAMVRYLTHAFFVGLSA